MTVVQPVAKLTRRVEDLELERPKYRKHTVLAVHVATSTYDADVEGVGRVNGFSAPPHFLPKVGDVFNLPLKGSVPGFEPHRIAPGAVGEEELAGYITENITIAMSAANGKNTFFYSPDAPTSATPGNTAGDSWMQRDNTTRVITGTWEWDGDSWESVTYGDEVLASLTVGKLVGGTGTFDLIVGGRIATAMDGQRTELNPLGLQGFNSAGTLTVNIDGVDNLLTGRVRTGLTGRRVEVGVTGASGEVRFFAADGTTQSFLRSYTDTASGQEGLQLGMPIAGAPATWNALYYNAQEWTSYQTKIHDFVYQDRWSIIATSDRGAGAGKRRMYLDPNGWQVRGGYLSDESRTIIYDFASGKLDLNHGNGGRISFSDGVAGQSPALTLVQPDGVGVILRTTSVSNLAAWFDVRNGFDNAYNGVRASEFAVNSDAEGKTNVTDATIAAPLSLVGQIRPRTYRRRNTGDSLETGVIAQELPGFLTNPGANSGEMSYSVVRWLLLLTAAAQELNQRLQELNQREATT